MEKKNKEVTSVLVTQIHSDETTKVSVKSSPNLIQCAYNGC